MRNVRWLMMGVVLSACMLGCNGLRLEVQETVPVQRVIVPSSPPVYYVVPSPTYYELQERRLRHERERWHEEHHEWHHRNRHSEKDGRSWHHEHERWHRHRVEP